MGADSVLTSFAAKVGAPPPRVEPEPGTADDLGAFGCLRGVREAARMLELRFRNGNITAFNYSMLDRVDFDPSDGITLTFGRDKVRIAGRNLNAELRPNVSLVQGLIRHRVMWVREDGESHSPGASLLPVVVRIVVE